MLTYHCLKLLQQQPELWSPLTLTPPPRLPDRMATCRASLCSRPISVWTPRRCSWARRTRISFCGGSCKPCTSFAFVRLVKLLLTMEGNAELQDRFLKGLDAQKQARKVPSLRQNAFMTGQQYGFVQAQDGNNGMNMQMGQVPMMAANGAMGMQGQQVTLPIGGHRPLGTFFFIGLPQV